MEISKKGILFLWLDSNQFHARMSKDRGVSVSQTYKKMNKIQKFIRNVQVKLELPFISYWFESWKNNIHKYHTVIVHASILTPAVVKFIRNKNKEIRIIIWYWNPIKKSVNISNYNNLNAEIWVFDDEDAEQYSLNYNTQYYFKDISLTKSEIVYDIAFIGYDKGRIEDISKLSKIFKEYNLSVYFHVVEVNGIDEKYTEYYKDKIEYVEILNIISKSKVILDLVSEGQTGLTLRPLEALFYEKKLITNDSTIIKRDFYNKENIFVLGVDNLENLSEFINSPYKKISREIIDKYDFESWIYRFFD